MNIDGPAICEIFMNTDQDFIPKVKGVMNNSNNFFSPPLEEMSPLLDYNTIKEIMENNISEKSKIITRT
jgi:acetolactate synthase-1/2/3 large subunit